MSHPFTLQLLIRVEWMHEAAGVTLLQCRPEMDDLGKDFEAAEMNLRSVVRDDLVNGARVGETTFARQLGIALIISGSVKKLQLHVGEKEDHPQRDPSLRIRR